MATISPFVVSGASGNIGKAVALALLAQGKAVRVIGRAADKLAPLVAKGAEAAIGSLDDVAFLSKALAGARGAFLMIPPNHVAPDFPAYQRRISEAMAKAVAASGLRHAVSLSSIGAHQPAGLGPITGLHHHEQRLRQHAGVALLHLRPAFFMENHLATLPLIKGMGIYGSPIPADLVFPQIATRDIAAVVAKRLAALDFSGDSTLELLGPADLTMSATTRALGTAIGKPELPYVQFPYDDARKAMVGAGLSPSMADQYIEMHQGFAAGLAAPAQARSAATSTPTTITQFAKDVFAPAYHGGTAAHG
jgi:uncharacterized protein YbjT (DUF2867 family)